MNGFRLTAVPHSLLGNQTEAIGRSFLSKKPLSNHPFQLSDDAPATIRERLKRASELLGGIDILERFKAWKAPEEL
jgi:hypothetical protein